MFKSLARFLTQSVVGNFQNARELVLYTESVELAELRRSIQRREKYFVEELAGFLISRHLGSGFQSEHIGESESSSDCRLTCAGTPCGLVEVMTHKDQGREALIAEILKADGNERLLLPAGQGAWTCEMTRETRFEDLTKENFCELIALLQLQGIDEISLGCSWLNGPAMTLLRKLGLRSLRRLHSDDNFVFRHMPIDGGMIDDSKDLLADYVEGLVNDPTIEKKLQRLSERADGLHRHFCIVIGSASGHSVEWRMNGTSLTPPLPERQISIPVHVDSVWVMSLSVGKVLNFDAKFGWTDFQFLANQIPWWEGLDLPHVQEMASLRRRYLKSIEQDSNHQIS